MAHTFTPGERVSATVYGERKVGKVQANPITVTGGRSRLVWVRWDGAKYAQWYHPESLTPEAQ